MSDRAKEIIREAEASRGGRTLAGALADRIAELEQRIDAAIMQGHLEGLICAKNEDHRAATGEDT